MMIHVKIGVPNGSNGEMLAIDNDQVWYRGAPRPPPTPPLTPPTPPTPLAISHALFHVLRWHTHIQVRATFPYGQLLPLEVVPGGLTYGR